MADKPMIPVVEEIIEEADRIRILVVGKSGVGKTSLIKKIFNVANLNVSHDRAGVSNIEEEIKSNQNDRFVAHDSEGYEPGEESKFEALQRFIEKRRSEVKLANKVHVIWLCIAIPHAGGRVLETGTEVLLKTLPRDIALIVVFTKYDRLVLSKEEGILEADPDLENDEEKLIQRCQGHGESDFKILCMDTLERFTSKSNISMPVAIKVSSESQYEGTLSELLRITEMEISRLNQRNEQPIAAENVVEGVAESLLAMAQMVDIDKKVELVIKVGRKKYWRGLASSLHFPGLGLQACLLVLHKDLVIPWNINDPHHLLLSGDFESAVTQLIESFQKSSDISDARKHFSKGIGLAGTVAGVAGAVATPVAPIVVPAVFVGMLFAHWVHDIYTSTPKTVRCLMLYILHLFNLMHGLFSLTQLGQSLPGEIIQYPQGYEVTGEDIERIFEGYKKSEVFKWICIAVNNFVQQSDILAYGSKDHVLDKLVQLMDKEHRFVPESSKVPGMVT
ncbi:hypothetical protein BT96DRAFT_1024864 [Gymnopus androsaceus JB14]|uniref:G domain-containing protein n=1 Tax=Gymnopus androsaceus JB14 TaxID=1447944 RepID=A0A6A4GWP7_9AGAR|nr:hypothetical protein BT96DRAFT_1024864 [Gymnopus androsaceus JB14]